MGGVAEQFGHARAVGGAGTVRVLAINPNPDPPLVDDWVEVPLGANLRDDYFLSTGQYILFNWYAEGVAPGEVTLELKFENGPIRALDRVVLTVVDMDIVELTFKGPGTEFFVIKQDDGSGDYGTPHWKDANRDGDALDTGPPADNRYPVAYLRDKYAQVTAVKVVYEPQGILSGTVRVFGDGPGGIDFQQDVTPASSEVTTGDVAAQNKFANEIDFFWPMNIDWRVSPDGGTVWLDAGRTSSQVYVTLNVPNTGSRYHTLLHNSCRDAKGKTTNNNGEVVAAIWSDFTDRVVRRVDPKGVTDGTQLTYYADWSCTNVTTAALLEHGDGQCGAWAKFFIDALGAQGINHADEYVVFYHVNTSFDYGFCVDDWSISGGGVSGHPTYPYLNLNANPLIQGNAYNWRFSEVADNTGVAGQGTANPASLFGNHQVVIIGNTYYDPSYGTTNASLHGIDTSAIDAYYFIPPSGWQVFEGTVNIDLNGDGDKMDTVVVLALHLLSSNSGANDLSETRYEYP